MTNSANRLISVVVPVYNEAIGLSKFNASLTSILEESIGSSYEIIYCNDGSTDRTEDLVKDLHDQDSRIKLISLSRNFGKENALSAGIQSATGEAILMIDGDGQHPVEIIPDFIKAWKDGSQVVIGFRTDTKGIGLFKRLGSWSFYKLFNRLTGQKLIPEATDFRLIDRSVQEAFLELKETDRITRGLIDWLGFDRVYIKFSAKSREMGKSTYSTTKLIGLATNSFASLTTTPLYIFGYLGVIITIASFILGLAVFIEQILLSDPWHWKFTGTAMLGIILLFLVGILLMSQGILSLYISHIHRQSKQRPLYVIDYKKSVGLKGKDSSV
jgi:polyisoprenyl-phosphate glycosyltransferase